MTPGLRGRLRDLLTWPFRRTIPDPPPGAAVGYYDPLTRLPVLAVGGSRLQIPAAPLAAAAAGDLLIHDGERWGVLEVGADGEVLTADSTEDLGVAWATAGGGTPTPDFTAVDKKYARWNAVLGTGMVDAAGNGLSVNGTGGDSLQAEGGFLRRFLLSGNNWAGFRVIPAVTIPPTRRQWLPVFRARWRTLTSTTGGFAIGLWECNTQPQDDPDGAAVGSGAHAIIRHYEGTDSFWSAASSDGTTDEVTATAVAIAADTVYTCEIVLSATDVKFYLNGSLIATHSTSIPNSTTPLGFTVQVRRLTGATTTAEIACHSISLTTL